MLDKPTSLSSALLPRVFTVEESKTRGVHSWAAVAFVTFGVPPTGERVRTAAQRESAVLPVHGRHSRTTDWSQGASLRFPGACGRLPLIGDQ
ncbi:hypothetical protein HPB52_009653 [Rhipicephalus sanguineus]|uniref:Uncharacterized protein n=1 Tax=Rhipicephalus sanguineus TaxID=34632 RepID=A0A9D4T960_RHISA|nr:hypothetical protein HPB52_009653 [Rhipicephalus sanguineus]